jgi:hypothetical protein
MLFLSVPNWSTADVIIDWNNVLLDTIRTNSVNPPQTTRAMAMVHAAMYDAVNSIAGTHRPYHIDLNANAGTSRESAAAQAAHHVLSNLFPGDQAAFDAALASSLANVADGPAKTVGINLGNAVGADIVVLRANDHSADIVPYTPGSNPGDWNPAPPAFAPALLPNWPTVTPWAMTSGSQFRDSIGPPALDSPEYTAAFHEVKELGSATNTTRTVDQTAIAEFWADGAGTSTPPGHWNRIAQTVAESQGNTLEENARLFALLGIAMADAAIVSWDNKYFYDHWRPVTAIRAALTDGNLATEPDPNWSSYIVTPPFPAYTSGHSTFSGAAASVLADFFGTDNIGFTSSAEGFPVPDRSFTNFSQAALEAMNSRLFGGIHWRYDNEDGLASGMELGNFVTVTQLLPIPEPSTFAVAGMALLAAMTSRRPKVRR